MSSKREKGALLAHSQRASFLLHPLPLLHFRISMLVGIYPLIYEKQPSEDKIKVLDHHASIKTEITRRYLPAVSCTPLGKPKWPDTYPHLQPPHLTISTIEIKQIIVKTHHSQSDHWYKSSRGACLHIFHALIYDFQLSSTTRAAHKTPSSLSPGRSVRIRRSNI